MDTHENDPLLAQLDRDLPDVDLASLEYFASFPFDSRIEQLLDNETPTVAISMSGHSDQLPDNLLFPSNEDNAVECFLSDDEVILINASRYRYSLKGSSSFDGSRLKVNVAISDDTSSSVGVKIEDVPNSNDAFIAYRIDPDQQPVSEVLDTKNLVRYLCLLANIEPRVVDENLKQVENTVAQGSHLNKDGHEGLKLKRRLFQDYFMNLWNQLGQETDGSSWRETRQIIHELPTIDPRFREVLRYQQTEEESPKESTLSTALEYAKIDTELDIEDTYSLNLVFSSQNRNTLDQDATRIISSVAKPMRLKKASAHQKVSGRPIQLDISDPLVQQLFVDWFDQLVSA